MPVNLEYFRLFCSVAKHQSITKAAEELSISRPAVSQELQKLEGQLGYSLFSRHPRGVRLTAEGTRLYHQIAPAIQTLIDAEQQAAAIRNLDYGSINISFNGLSLQHTFHSIITEFKHAYPNIVFHNSVINRHALKTALLSGAVDLAFVLRPSFKPIPSKADKPVPELAEYSLGTFEDIFFVHRHMAHLAQRKIHLRELASYPFVFLREQPLRGVEYYDDHIKTCPSAREQDLQLDRMETIIEFLTFSDRIGVAPSISVQPFADNTELIPLNVWETGFPVQYLLIFPKDKQPNFAAIKLIDYMLNLDLFDPKEISCSI